MAIALGCIVPHPPILVPDIGKESLNKISSTQKAMEKLSLQIAELQPETLVFISPHSPAFTDAIAVKSDSSLKGSLKSFGSSFSVTAKNDLELVEAVVFGCQAKDIPTFEFNDKLARRCGYDTDLDHGVLVPFYYLGSKLKLALVSLSISCLSYLKHYELGMIIAKTAKVLKRKVVFVASGDLSHRLSPQAPGGFSPRGREFDQQIQDLFSKGNFSNLLSLEPSLIEEAGECGLRSLITLAGTFDGFKIKTDVYSYEGPFGVGYLVGCVNSLKEAKERALFEAIKEAKLKTAQQKRKEESFPVSLARQTAETYVREGEVITPPAKVPSYLRGRAGVFVSIKKEGQLRGCIGTTTPIQADTAHEIIRNAISSATEDPRFPPIEASELGDLTFSVDILGRSEEVESEDELDSTNYGVIVEAGSRRGLLLPDLEGVDTVSQQIEIAKQKAGISPNELVKLYRFKVKRYH